MTIGIFGLLGTGSKYINTLLTDNFDVTTKLEVEEDFNNTVGENVNLNLYEKVYVARRKVMPYDDYLESWASKISDEKVTIIDFEDIYPDPSTFLNSLSYTRTGSGDWIVNLPIHGQE